jgi:hypothetical protein
VNINDTLPIPNDWVVLFGGLAELRFDCDASMQAANSWGWADEARKVLADHLEAHGDELRELFASRA